MFLVSLLFLVNLTRMKTNTIALAVTLASVVMVIHASQYDAAIKKCLQTSTSQTCQQCCRQASTDCINFSKNIYPDCSIDHTNAQYLPFFLSRNCHLSCSSGKRNGHVVYDSPDNDVQTRWRWSAKSSKE